MNINKRSFDRFLQDNDVKKIFYKGFNEGVRFRRDAGIPLLLDDYFKRTYYYNFLANAFSWSYNSYSWSVLNNKWQWHCDRSTTSKYFKIILPKQIKIL